MKNWNYKVSEYKLFGAKGNSKAYEQFHDRLSSLILPGATKAARQVVTSFCSSWYQVFYDQVFVPIHIDTYIINIQRECEYNLFNILIRIRDLLKQTANTNIFIVVFLKAKEVFQWGMQKRNKSVKTIKNNMKTVPRLFLLHSHVFHFESGFVPAESFGNFRCRQYNLCVKYKYICIKF